MAAIDPAILDALRNRYLIERELGRGGMAVVYRAHDVRHDRPVAVKVLRPELAVSLGGDRFLREIRFAARLQHPHILPLLDSGEISPGPAAGHPVLWYAMPLVNGESLRERLRTGRVAVEASIDRRFDRSITRRGDRLAACARHPGS